MIGLALENRKTIIILTRNQFELRGTSVTRLVLLQPMHTLVKLASTYLKSSVSDKLGLPTGKYDVPLMLAGKQFLASGQLKSPEGERVSLYRDNITVNAQPWPFMEVERRKYKFRLLDASIST
jgi:hypothetical protein